MTITMNDEGFEKHSKLAEAYRTVFSTVDGKMILKDLEYFCFGNDSTYTPNSDLTVFNEGRRSAYLYIKAMTDTDPKSELQKEGA